MRVLLPTALFAVVGCSDGTVLVLKNETTCSFEEIEGIKINPRNGKETMVFALDRIDPGDDRPVYFDLDWEGTLRITASIPPGFQAEFPVTPDMEGEVLALNPNGPLECRLRSPAEYQQ
ncbi:MAG: hypothetical protein V2I43_00180 [Parvularcula sp.]|jgi:hypothetical protein|nr:hypothetical protein [Parvularcula sp.]